jgi:hypothetical protein
MKTKFFLTLLAINSLFLGENSAFAFTTSSTATSQNISNLSHKISTLVDLDQDSHSLVEFAINRALLAKTPASAGGHTPGQPFINGKIANPNPHTPPPLINGVIANPNPHTAPPLINGVVIANPDPHTSPPLINGVIANPHSQTPPVIINGTIAVPEK